MKIRNLLKGIFSTGARPLTEGNIPLLLTRYAIPFLIANTNMYGGTKRTISDDDMKIEKDGRWCFNMKTIADLVADGYLPVKDKNLREWVKWHGGAGYYSDWIVTLTEAKRQSDTESDLWRSVLAMLSLPITISR